MPCPARLPALFKVEPTENSELESALRCVEAIAGVSALLLYADVLCIERLGGVDVLHRSQVTLPLLKPNYLNFTRNTFSQPTRRTLRSHLC